MTRSEITKFLATGKNRPGRMLRPQFKGMVGGSRVTGWPNMSAAGVGPGALPAYAKPASPAQCGELHRVKRFTAEGMTHRP